MTDKIDLEYLASRWIRLADEDHESSQSPEISPEIRQHREARAEGLRWAARELREYVLTPEYVAPPHLAEGG